MLCCSINSPEKDPGPGNVVYSGKTNFSFLPPFPDQAPLHPPLHERGTLWERRERGGRKKRKDKTKREETAPDLFTGKFPPSIMLLFDHLV